MMTVAEKLTKIAENEPKVYEAGHDAGYTEGINKGGYADGFEEGKKEEYDAFWDAFQQNGARTDYQGGFYGSGWNDSNFKPKYDMKPKNCAQMFVSSKITDLCAALDGCGVTLDTSASVRVDNMYYYSGITKVPTLDTRQAANLDSTFLESKAESVEKILLKDDGSQRFNNSFVQATALKDITFDGVIGLDINFQHSTKLSADSIRSIIEHLSDTEPPAGQPKKTLTLSRTAVENAIANGEFGGDTVYMTTDGEFGGYLDSNPILLSKGQTIKVMAEWKEGHTVEDYTDWWFGFSGDSATFPNFSLPWTYTAKSDEQLVIMWYFSSDQAVTDIPIKIRVVLIDENGNEVTGENLHSFMRNTLTNDNGKTLTIADESWETLQASKPNWTITLV